jgi:hypothetical protein
MQCPACGVEVIPEAVFCHKCGQRLDSPGTGTPQGQHIEDALTGTPGNAVDLSAPLRQDSRDQPEQELWRGGYSSKAMLGAWVASGLASLALLVGGVFWRPAAIWWLVLLVLMVLPWAYYFAVLCYRRMSVHYLLTTRRFIHERGILRRVNDRIEVLDMDDITFEQKLWERMTGVGTIRIASHDRSDPELFLPGIEKVKEVATLLDNARLAERRRRGLHVEQI